MKASIDRSVGDSVVAERRDEIYTFYNERAPHTLYTVMDVQFHMPNISEVES